jgi:hypothetical protein
MQHNQCQSHASFPFTYRRALVPNDQAIASLDLIPVDGVERLLLRVVAAGRANKSGDALARELDQGAAGAQGALQWGDERGGEEVSMLKEVYKAGTQQHAVFLRFIL